MAHDKGAGEAQLWAPCHLLQLLDCHCYSLLRHGLLLLGNNPFSLAFRMPSRTLGCESRGRHVLPPAVRTDAYSPYCKRVPESVTRWQVPVQEDPVQEDALASTSLTAKSPAGLTAPRQMLDGGEIIGRPIGACLCTATPALCLREPEQPPACSPPGLSLSSLAP